jgi:hypothetical protein
MLTPQDDLIGHQTPEPFAKSGGDDSRFTERHWYTAHPVDGFGSTPRPGPRTPRDMKRALPKRPTFTILFRSDRDVECIAVDGAELQCRGAMEAAGVRTARDGQRDRRHCPHLRS